MDTIDYKEVLLQLIASLTLADHTGDMWEDMETALRKIGMEPPDFDDLSDLGRWLGQKGITTLCGTILGEYDD